MSIFTEKSAIASFDLYDTVVMRRSLTTKSVYESVWTTLRNSGHSLPDCPAFIDARMRADVASKHLDAPTLSQVLKHLDGDLLGLAKEIESVEIAIEMEQLRKIPGCEKIIDQARSAGYQIAFISDMHIGSIHIEPRLRQLGLLLDGDLLMVSCDHAVSKSRQGRLFEKFLRTNSISAESVTHFGDNVWSDVKMAVKHGISAHLCPSAHLNRFESLLVNESDSCGELEQIASTSRDTRLHFGAGGAVPITEISKEEEALYKVASSVAGPVMVAFVLWVIKRCREESISSLRFLTRDGELPYLIAKALPSELTDGLNLEMFEVSRKSLLLPAASVLPLEKWLEVGLAPGSYLVQQYDLVPARQVIARVGLSFDNHADLLSQFNIVDSEKPLGNAGLACWKRALEANCVREAIKQESGRRLKSTNAYLRQHLPGMSEKRFALIDIGWTGQQAAMLSAMIRQQGGLDPLHLHVGRMKGRPLIVEANIEGWLFDGRLQRSPVENPVALFETFCVTTSGGVDSYQLDSTGVATAVRRTQEHQPNILLWGQPALRHCVLRFAEHAGGLMNNISSELLRDVCETLLKEYWENPSWHEAKKWGAFPYEQDQTGLTIRRLANPYNLAQLRARLGDNHSGIDWKAGSVALSPTPVRQLLKFREKYRRR